MCKRGICSSDFSRKGTEEDRCIFQRLHGPFSEVHIVHIIPWPQRKDVNHIHLHKGKLMMASRCSCL